MYKPSGAHSHFCTLQTFKTALKGWDQSLCFKWCRLVQSSFLNPACLSAFNCKCALIGEKKPMYNMFYKYFEVYRATCFFSIKRKKKRHKVNMHITCNWPKMMHSNGRKKCITNYKNNTNACILCIEVWMGLCVVRYKHFSFAWWLGRQKSFCIHFLYPTPFVFQKQNRSMIDLCFHRNYVTQHVPFTEGLTIHTWKKCIKNAVR